MKMNVAKNVLSCFLGIMLTGPLLAATASICNNKPIGPCVECTLAVDQPEQLLNLPPLYWDLCADQTTQAPLLYFLPKSISVVNKNEKLQQSLRLRNGELFLSANLNYQPWGGSNDLAQAVPLAFLKKKYPGIRFVLAPQTSIETRLQGQWQQWVKSINLTPVSGIDAFQTLRLEVTFKKEFESRVNHALARPLGILGRTVMTFQAYDAKGQVVEARHDMALHLGGVSLRP